MPMPRSTRPIAQSGSCCWVEFESNRPASGQCLGFTNLQRHAVAFADGRVFRPVLVAQGQRRWQGPHALLPFGRVLRVGVDLRRTRELESSFLGERANGRDLDVATLAFTFCASGFGQAVILDTEHAARLEHGEDFAECGFAVVGLFRLHVTHLPVVHVAEGEHDVGSARRNAGAAKRGREVRTLDLAVQRRVGIEPLGHRLVALARRCRGDQLALRREIGGEDLGVPATARPQFHDGVRRLDADEAERLDRVTVDIARTVGFTALRAGHRLLERLAIGLIQAALVLGMQLCAAKQADAGKRCSDDGQTHGSLL